MKTAVLFLRFFALCFIILPVVVHAQAPEWEDAVQLTDLSSGRSVESAFSNGYGQHIGVARNSNGQYYLIGNNGSAIFQKSDVGESQQGATATTAFGSNVNVVTRHRVTTVPAHDVIWLWRSSDGGEHWPSNALEYNPADDFSNQDIASIDAYADARGIHIVWESSSEVYYILYNPNIPGFAFPKQVTDTSSGTGKNPKIVTSASKAHVSFVRTDVNPDAAATRDATFSTNQGVTWENGYEDVPLLQPGVDGVFYQSIARRGDTLHLVSYEHHSGGSPEHEIQASKRYINGTSWPQSDSLTNFSSSRTDGRRSLTVLGDTVFGVYAPFSGNTLRQMVYKAATGWITSEVWSGTTTFERPTISSSRTGVYFYWHHNTYSTAWIKRKPFHLSGSISENMFFTGNNWVTGDLTIQSGVTATLKAGSITYVSDSTKIIVENGATLMKERGSQIIFGTGATYQLNASLDSLWNMTGIPAVVPDFYKDAVYPTRTSNPFEYHDGYVQADTLKNDRGYWIKFGNDQNHAYEGGFIDSMAMNVYNGWNIIGSISCPIDTGLIYTEPADIWLHTIFRYSTADGYTPATILYPGEGFWTKTSAAGKIILNLRSEVDAGRSIPGPFSKVNGDEPSLLDTYDRFTVTDAAGMRQHLYVRNATLAGTTENIEMPPPLPDSSFDVRFSPGDFLRSVIPDSEGIDLSIALNAVTYPAELSWNINPDNGLTYTMLLDSGNGLGKGTSLKSIRGSSSLLMSSRGNGFVRFNVSNRQVEESDVPGQFALQQNYPNPFNPSTTISYDLPIDSKVTLKVFDVLGREVATLVNSVEEPGYKSVQWNATNVASGIYFYRLHAGDFTLTKKLILLR